MTKHSNIGDLRIIFTLCFKSILNVQTESTWECIRKIFNQGNKYNVKTLVLSIESFLQSTHNMKQYFDMLNKIFKMIRTEVSALSHDYPLCHNLKKVLILLPQTVDQPNFEKSKELFKNCFE